MLYEVFGIIAIYHHQVKIVRKVLKLKDLVSLAVIIILHFFRLSHAGSVCSGDYPLSDSTDYLMYRGYFFLILLYGIWLIIGIFMILAILYMIYYVGFSQ